MKNEMLKMVIKATLENYDFKNDKVIFIRKSYENNKYLVDMILKSDYDDFDMFFIDDKYFEDKDNYAVIVDKRYYKI